MNLTDTCSISTPTDLKITLQALKRAIAGGRLEQIHEAPSQFTTNMRIEEIPDDGPWPDYIELHFQIKGHSSKYILAVDTYHGSGGWWGPKSSFPYPW